MLRQRKQNKILVRTISSVGRAARLHRVGRQFETVIVHQNLRQRKYNGIDTTQG